MTSRDAVEDRAEPRSTSQLDPNAEKELQYRLQLLEERFTGPLDHGAYPLCHQQQQQSNLSTSPATLDPENSSPASFPNTSRSQHSFGFDTPYLSSKESKKQRISTSPEWRDVALAHMEKIAQEDNTILTSHHRKADIHDGGAAAEATALSNPFSVSNQIRVQESPPFVSPKPEVKVLKTENKRKSIMPTKRAKPSVRETDDDTRKRTKLQFDKSVKVASTNSAVVANKVTKSPKSSNSRSPLRSTSPRQSNSRSEHSRETTKVSKTKVANNTKLEQFFKVKNSKDSRKRQTCIDSTPKENEAAVEGEEERRNKNVSELEQLKQEYERLQRTCNDKDAQLKAVSNNRTILHTSLQATLQKRDEELLTLEESTQRREEASRSTLEELVRDQATTEARELRDRLAADGSRLGRIVATPAPTRTPFSRMPRAMVESWEEGHAPKQLALRRKQLQVKLSVLEQRYADARAADDNLSKQSSSEAAPDNPLATNGENRDVLVVGGIEIRTALDAREAVESVRFHLSNVKRKEKELSLEEQALGDEKGVHIRELKRVASEDASRFRTRPKLHDRYVLKSLLGKGGFSEVWSAFDLHELRQVAVKIHQLDSRWPDSKKENYTKHVSREYEIHRNVRHPRIVSLYDVFEIDTNSFATVLECCVGTDLDTLLKTKRRLGERDARSILLQILLGMNYLSHPSEDGSRQGIIHYDLKPGNILFDEYGDAKITDFGLSKIVDTPDAAESMELTSQGAGTYWYLPPECFFMEEDVRISNKVDVWSIGVIFFQMLFGKRPFGDGQSQDRILSDGTMLNAKEVKFPDKPEITNAGKEFIRACLTYDQNSRPSIAQICQHKYVLARDL